MKPPAKPRKTPTGCPSSTPSASSAASCLPQSPFPPQHRAAFHDAVLREILQERVPDRRGRRNPRGVKRKMSSFPLRKRGDPTPPAFKLADVISIINEPYWGLGHSTRLRPGDHGAPHGRIGSGWR